MRLGSVAVCCFLLSVTAFAQSDRGTITGTVADPAGAVVANAAIQGKNVETGVVYPAATSSTGNYTLVQLPVGTYEITVSVPGFKKYTRTGLEVQVAQTIRIDIPLEVGSASESVTVSAEASLLKTESGELSHNVNVRQLDELPLLGIGGSAAGTQGIRNPNAVAQVIPGTYWAPNADLRVNGAPNNTQSYRIEGQEAMNTGTPGTPGQNQPSVDAIQELAVQTSNFAAEFGQVGGGVFNLTMRSGTNQYHGSGYDYFVNEFLNAGNPYTDNGQGGNTRQKQRRNDYGFTIGGPVWIPKIYNGRDKTFFFVNWEEFRETQIVNNQQGVSVPFPAYRTGDFSAAILPNARLVGTDPLNNVMKEGMVYDPTSDVIVGGKDVRTQFPGNKIPVTSFDPVAAKIQNLFPSPKGINAGALVNNYINPYSSHRITPIPSIKIDESFGKGKLSFFWQRTKTTNPDGNATLGRSDGLPNLISPALGTFTTAPLYRLNYDYTLSPTMLLHMGGGYRATYFATPNVTPDGKVVYSEVKYNAATELGLKGGLVNRFFPSMTGLVSSTLGGIGTLNGIGGSASDKPVTTQSPTFNLSLTWVKNNHTFKYGSEFRTENYYAGGYGTDGSYGFSAAQTGQPFQSTAVGGANVGLGYASFLLGQVQSVSIGGPTAPRTGKKQFGVYVQDTWKITRKLTLDYGLRYDYSTYLQEQYGRGAVFSPTAIHPLAGIPGAGVYDQYGPKQCNCNIAHNYPFAFGPRLGMAYQINRRTVLRAGFGIVYSGTEQNNNGTGGLASSTGGASSNNFGFPISILANGIASTFDPPAWPTYDPGFFPTGFPTPGTGPIAIDRNAGRPARQYQWSVGIQREITSDLAIEVAYVGNRGIWWEAPEQVNYNAIDLARLQKFNLDPTKPADQTLLTARLSDAVAAQRGFAGKPYALFPTSQTVAQALRPFPQFTTISAAWDPLGKTWYDSLQVKATKRLSHGISSTTTFTWQKNLSFSGDREPNFGTAANGQVNDVFNRQVNKYISQYSQPLTFLTSINYTTPKLKGNKWLSYAAQDWTYGAFLAYRSGLPLLVPSAQSTPSLGSMVFQNTFAVRVPGQPLYLQDLNCHCFDPRNVYVLNPKAWTDPAPGTFSPSPAFYSDYNQQRRPQENMNVGRTFRLAKEGRVTLNVRAEFTNVFNRAFISSPISTNGTTSTFTRNPNGTTSAGFGALLPSTTLQPRNGLLIARIQF
jgi:hypothetical protein